MNKEELKKVLKERTGTGVQIIEKDTKFQFICDGCRDGSSDCCCNRKNDPIIINPYDVYKLQKGLGKNSREIIDEHCIPILGGQSGYPLLLLKAKKIQRPYIVEEVCTFLQRTTDENGKSRRYCSVHDFKPGVCSIFPLGRVQSPGDEMIYFLQDINCGLKPTEKDPKITIKEYVPNLENEDAAFLKYYEVMSKISKVVALDKLNSSQKIPQGLKNIFCVLFLYILCDFDSDKDYFEQLDENAELVISFMKEGLLLELAQFDEDVVVK